MSEIIAPLIGLKRYSEMRNETFRRKPWFQGLSNRGDWRTGELVEFLYAYARLKDAEGEFLIPASHLCHAQRPS